MYYIKDNPSGANYGNPQTTPFAGAIKLPDELLSTYLEAKGFVKLAVTDGEVTAIETDEEALATYEAEHPEPEPVEPEPTPDDDRDAMLVDLEYRVTLLELGLEEEI